VKIFFNRFRLGDCLWSCHWLRKVALANPLINFAFFCDRAHHWQLKDVLMGTQVYLLGIENYHGGGIDTWINARGEYPPKDKDQVKFFTQVFDRVAEESGLENPLKKREDWLFDYFINRDSHPRMTTHWLFVDSQPQSGQFNNQPEIFDLLEKRIVAKGQSVERTSSAIKGDGAMLGPSGRSITGWGSYSHYIENILMIATGPCWTTFNAVTESRLKHRIILQGEGMILNYGREWPHFTNLPDAVKYMEKEGLV